MKPKRIPRMYKNSPLMQYVLVVEDGCTNGNHYSGEYYTGKTYIHAGERYAVTHRDGSKAKIYKGLTGAKKGLDSLNNNSQFKFKIEVVK